MISPWQKRQKIISAGSVTPSPNPRGINTPFFNHQAAKFGSLSHALFTRCDLNWSRVMAPIKFLSLANCDLFWALWADFMWRRMSKNRFSLQLKKQGADSQLIYGASVSTSYQAIAWRLTCCDWILCHWAMKNYWNSLEQFFWNATHAEFWHSSYF